MYPASPAEIERNRLNVAKRIWPIIERLLSGCSRCWRTLPAFRHVGLASPAAVASERTEEARTAHALEYDKVQSPEATRWRTTN